MFTEVDGVSIDDDYSLTSVPDKQVFSGIIKNNKSKDTDTDNGVTQFYIMSNNNRVVINLFTGQYIVNEPMDFDEFNELYVEDYKPLKAKLVIEQ